MRRPISTHGVPGSSSAATRSRGASLPCWCILATRAGPPPSRSLAASAWYSAVSSRSREAFAGVGAVASVLKVLRRPGLDVGHEVRGGRAGPEEPADPLGVEGLDVLPGDD